MHVKSAKLFLLKWVVIHVKPKSFKMMNKNNYSKILATLMVFFVLASFHAIGQKNNNLTVYKSSDEMVAAAKEIITEIPVKEFKKHYDQGKGYVIDVRTSSEFEAGAIPGAINIQRGVLEFKIGNEELWKENEKSIPEKSDQLFVYCKTGGRGALSTKALMQLGYTNVKSIQGGWEAWYKNYPDLKE